MANFDSEFFSLVFSRVSGHPKNSRPKFTSRIVATPLQFHFLEPKVYSRRFSAYGGNRNKSGWPPSADNKKRWLRKTQPCGRDASTSPARSSTPSQINIHLACSLQSVTSGLLLTRYTTSLNPKAGLGLQRQSARRQPVVQAQILVVQGLLCGSSSEKVPYYRAKGLGVQGKRWQNYRYCFSCLKVRGGALPSKLLLVPDVVMLHTQNEVGQQLQPDKQHFCAQECSSEMPWQKHDRYSKRDLNHSPDGVTSWVWNWWCAWMKTDEKVLVRNSAKLPKPFRKIL